MITDLTEASDADLNAMIYDNPSEHEDSGESNDNSVSPTMDESEEQPDDTNLVPDVDQPDEVIKDSEEDSTDDDQTDDNEEETPTEDNETSEDDTDPSEDKGSDTDDNNQEKPKFQPLKANGKEYPIDSIDELYKLASAGVGAQQKFQFIAPHRKTIMAAEKAGVDLMEAVNMMANYKANPEEAIMKLIKSNNINIMEMDQGKELTVDKDYSVSDFEAAYDEVVGEIGNSPIFPKVQNLLLKEWDKDSRDVFLDKPQLMKNLHEEMTPVKELGDKSMFELVSPIAEKMKLSGDTRSDYAIYMSARELKISEFQKHEDTVNKVSTKEPVSKPDVKEKKKKASPTRGNSTNNKTLDFSSMSDAELDAFLEKNPN